MATRRKVLRIENFGPIRKVEVPFADITVLVGPQATGKSLVLQWLKLAVERVQIPNNLAGQGFVVWNDPRALAGRFFGRDYADSVTEETSVTFAGSPVELKRIAKKAARRDLTGVLFIPAHRALVMSTGWPLLFREHGDDTPYVVREFSESIWAALHTGSEEPVLSSVLGFPRELWRKLDDAVFHAGRVSVARDQLGKLQLKLIHDRRVRLSTMEWTTGQREVFPLLVGLTQVLPIDKPNWASERTEWVVVEEPELGLHPDGILAVMCLLLEVARRGHRIVLSTHSPLVLDVLWSMQQLRGKPRADRKLLQILGVEDTHAMRVYAQEILRKDQSIMYLSFEGGAKVHSRDISNLDPGSPEKAEAQWGGLLGHSTRIADVVAGAS